MPKPLVPLNEPFYPWGNKPDGQQQPPSTPTRPARRMLTDEGERRFEEHYDKWEFIKNIAMANGVNPADVEDIAQNVFTTRGQMQRIGDGLRTDSFLVAHCEITDEFRRQKRRRLNEQAFDPWTTDERRIHHIETKTPPVIDRYEAVENAGRKALEERLRRGGLSEKQLRLLQAAALGHSQDKIAQMFGMKDRDVVKEAMSYVRQKARTILSQGEE